MKPSIRWPLLLLLPSGLAGAWLVTVTPEDPFREILATLGEGDTLFLSPGTYTAPDTLPILHLGPPQDGLTVTSDPEDRAVLDGDGHVRPVLLLEGGLSPATLVENLVITGGNATGTDLFAGGGIFLSTVDAVIVNCLIRDNVALFGGGIGVEGGSPGLFDCELTGNEALATGGGLNLFACGLEASGLRFTGNASSDDGAGLCAVQTDLHLSSCLFSGNSSGDDGGGLAIQQGATQLEFVTIHGNACSDDGGGMLLHASGAVEISSCIITANTGRGGVTTKGTAPSVRNTCCWGNEYLDWWGMEDPTGDEGNISSDPLFADSLLHLSSVAAGQAMDSPAIDAGHLQVPGSPVEGLSTRTDSLPDLLTADMGFHTGRTSPREGVTPLLPGPLTLLVRPCPCSGSPEILIGSDPASLVEIRVFDLAGRRIASPGTFQVDGVLEVPWDVPDDLPDGILLFQAISGTWTASATLVLLR